MCRKLCLCSVSSFQRWVPSPQKWKRLSFLSARFVCQKPPQWAWACSVPASRLPVSGLVDPSNTGVQTKTRRTQPPSEETAPRPLVPVCEVWGAESCRGCHALGLCVGRGPGWSELGTGSLGPVVLGVTSGEKAGGQGLSFRKVTSQVPSCHPIARGQLTLCSSSDASMTT